MDRIQSIWKRRKNDDLDLVNQEIKQLRTDIQHTILTEKG
jgi:hypothetical protein